MSTPAVPGDARSRSLLLVVADGVRHDVLAEELDAGHLPALAGLRSQGGLHTVSTSFPSVTGPAYVPFLTGRMPGPAGLPGLRWYDRERRIGLWPAHSRSYAGVDIWHLDTDLDADTPTLLELARPSLAALSMLGRGASIANVGRSMWWMARVAPGHFRGDLEAWQKSERAGTRIFLDLFAQHRPRFSVLALLTPDKRAHKVGGQAPSVRASLTDIDDAVRRAQEIAERGGWRDALNIWLVGDHGHAPVSQHEDLHRWIEQRGLRVRAHPRVFKRRADVALMVGGNAMAHVYLDPGERTRHWWPELSGQWSSLHDALLERDAVDLLAVALSGDRVRVSSRRSGVAEIVRIDSTAGPRWDYLPDSGDPLGLGGALRGLDSAAAHAASMTSDYPDALVQLTSLLHAPRSGDIVISATPGWDLRARFEPSSHVSTHGSLHREQMLVPLLVDRPVERAPLRTADVMPSALQLLGLAEILGLDGRSFL